MQMGNSTEKQGGVLQAACIEVQPKKREKEEQKGKNERKGMERQRKERQGTERQGLE